MSDMNEEILAAARRLHSLANADAASEIALEVRADGECVLRATSSRGFHMWTERFWIVQAEKKLVRR